MAAALAPRAELPLVANHNACHPHIGPSTPYRQGLLYSTSPFASPSPFPSPSPLRSSPLAFGQHHLSPPSPRTRVLPPFRARQGGPLCPIALPSAAGAPTQGPSSPKCSKNRLRLLHPPPCAGGGQGSPPGEKEFVDTRIHWDDPDEGWVDWDNVAPPPTSGRQGASSSAIWPMSRDLVVAIMEVESTHYRVLGVTPTADMESVKVAYRRLSKLFHPDTTELPLELAEQKFVQLREAYSVLSNAEQRRLYDWKIASDCSQKRGQRFVWPYEVDQSQRGPGSRSSAPLDPKPVAGGSADDNGNVPLSDGSMAAITFDLFAVVVSITVIIVASYLKNAS